MVVVSTERRLWFMLFLFKFGGFPITTKKLSLLHGAYNMTVSLSSYSVYLAALFNVYKNIDEIASAMTALCHALLMIAFLCVEVNYRLHMKTMKRLLDLVESFTWEDMPQIDLETGELTMAGWMPRIEKFSKKCAAITLAIHFIQSATKVFTTDDFIYDTLYPFETSVSPVYEIILVTQLMTMSRLTIFFFGAPYAYITLVCIACTQLQKVKLVLLQMKQKHSELNNSKMTQVETEEDSLEMQKKFNDIVWLHQQVIIYLETLNDMMSLLLAGVLFFILLTQCTAAFAAVLNLDNINELCRVVFLYISVTTVAFIYCSFGTLLSQEYESVSNTAWGSDWIGTPVPFQRCISFMISISNKGFALTAAKFVTASNATLMSMINESMSLFMFLLTMKDKSG